MNPVPFSQHVLRALNAARTPGWMFPAHLLDVFFEQQVSEDGAIALMHIGDHCRDASGRVSTAALSVLADVCMAAAVRGYVGKSVRVATVSMRLSFNQRPCKGRLRAVAKVQFLPTERAVATAVVAVRISDEEGGWCVTGEATFAVLENKQGTAQHPLPTQSTLTSTLDSRELSDEEQEVWNRARTCEAYGLGALESFWSLSATCTEITGEGGQWTANIAKHNSNRVGHLQGGVLLGLLARASQGTAKTDFELGDIYVQYLDAVSGPQALIQSKALRLGRNTAFIYATMSSAQGQLLATAQVSLLKLKPGSPRTDVAPVLCNS